MTALTTLTALKAELGITGTASDVRAQALIKQASATIETYLGRRLGRRSLTDLFRNPWDFGTRWRSVPRLYLSAWPVVADSVVVVENAITLSPTDYTLDAEEGMLTRGVYGVSYGPLSYAWGENVSVSYDGGYILPGTDGADLPGDIERACLDLAIRSFHGAARDPALRSETVPGVIEQTWTSAENIPTLGGLPIDIAQALISYKRVVI
jgi:hypothetical protein